MTFIKIFNVAKPLRIRFNKIDGFIEIHDKTKYLVLFGYSYWYKICDKIKYLISEKSCMRNSINHNFAGVRIQSQESYDSIITDKVLTFHTH